MQNVVDEINCFLLGGQAITLFRTLNAQKNELANLKPSTLEHIWVREQNGKLEIVPLDDDFGRIQARVVVLEGCIVANERLVDKLNAVFQDCPLQDFDARLREIGGKIESLECALNVKVLPFHQAAEIAHADPEKVPEVLQARAETAIKITALKRESEAIKAKQAEISPILESVAR